MIMKHILYLAKEPGKGVRDDLSRLSGKEVTVVDCLGAYGDYYRKMGYNVISKTKYFELDGIMRFDVVIGNPPYGSGANCWLVISSSLLIRVGCLSRVK